MPIPSLKALRRLVPAAAAVLAALGVWAALAWGAPTVTIVTPDESTVTVDLAEREPDAPTYYTLRSGQGQEPQRRKIAVYPLNEIFVDEGINRRIQEVILNDNGVVIDELQLNAVPPPGFYIDDEGAVRFIRNSFHDKDFNYTVLEREHVVTEIRQSSESSLDLQASAKRVAPGEPVTFEVATSGGGKGQRYEFRWDFGDGATATGSKVEHDYDGKGPFKAEVTALSPGKEGLPVAQRTEPVQVTFKKPKVKEDEKDESGDTTTDATGGTGTTVGGTTYDGSVGTGGSGSTGTPATDSFDPITTDQDTALAGNTVEGALLTNVDAPLAGAGGGSAVAADPLHFKVPEPGGEIPPAAWSGFGALALMGAGALVESGRRPRLRRPRLRLSLPRR